MKELIGKTIKEIYVIGEYQQFMKFVTDEGDLIYFADGDCCSQSYFSEVWGVEKIIGKKILEVEELSLEEGEVPVRESRQDSDQIYGIKLKSAPDEENDRSNVCTIVFRNSSNGYYGGSIELINEEMYGFKDTLEKLNEETRIEKIEKDYQAPQV